MAATRCAVAVFKRVYRKPVQASSVDRVAGLVAGWLSLHERLTFRSVSRNISLQLEEELKREVWDPIEADGGPLLGTEWEPYCYEIQRNAVAFCCDDIHKILLLLMLGFCGVVVPIRRTTVVYAAREG